MISPHNTAKETLRKYFASKGEETPHARAHSLLQRITLLRDHFWRSDTLCETAQEIIASARFDVDDLVERFLGIDLTIEPLHELDKRAGAPVFGLARARRRQIVICERAERYLPLYRTTVAHELGHILLHASSRASALNYSPESPRRPQHESEADQFMVALLVSRPLLLLTVPFHADRRGLSPHDVLMNANTARGRWQWREFLFRLLIEDLCLSREFLAYQMSWYGVFTEETVRLHLRYPLLTKWREK